MAASNAQGCEASPSASVVASESVTITACSDPNGCGAGEKVKDPKRPVLTDNVGNLVNAIVHTADMRDRDGAPTLLAQIMHRFPLLRHLFADDGYAGRKPCEALRLRRVDEPMLAWLCRNRRLAKNFEKRHRSRNCMDVGPLGPTLHQMHLKALINGNII